MDTMEELREELEELEAGAEEQEASEERNSDRCPPEEFILANEFIENFTPGLKEMAEFGADLKAVNETAMDFGNCLLNSRERALDQLYKFMLLTSVRLYLHTRYKIERRLDKTKGERWGGERSSDACRGRRRAAFAPPPAGEAPEGAYR